jgi:hypothetical protein
VGTSIIRNAEVADPGIVRHANEAQTRDRGTNGPGLTGKMMHRAVAPGPGYSAAIAMPGSRQGAARSPPPRRAAPSSSGHGQVPNASMDVGRGGRTAMRNFKMYVYRSAPERLRKRTDAVLGGQHALSTEARQLKAAELQTALL